jgi:WD40 repeat protein
MQRRRPILFNPEGTLLVSGGRDGSIRFWDIENRNQLRETTTRHEGSVFAVAFSTDGRRIASTGQDGSIKLWDPDTGEEINVLLSGKQAYNSLAFSPDGILLASAGLDGAVRLWEPQEGQQVGEPFWGHPGAIYTIAFNPDGSLLASSGEDGTILIWDTSAESWVEKACARAGRNFSPLEWEYFLPGDEFQLICPQWDK